MQTQGDRRCDDTTLPVSLRAQSCRCMHESFRTLARVRRARLPQPLVCSRVDRDGGQRDELPGRCLSPPQTHSGDAPGNGTLNGADVAFTGHWRAARRLCKASYVLQAPRAALQRDAWTSPGHTQERWCRDCALGGGLAVSAQQFQVFAIPVQGSPSPALPLWGALGVCGRRASSPTHLGDGGPAVR